jgi:hypothetical protein
MLTKQKRYYLRDNKYGHGRLAKNALFLGSNVAVSFRIVGICGVGMITELAFQQKITRQNMAFFQFIFITVFKKPCIL